MRNMFQMLGILESKRDDDDDVEAPIHVFDDNENGRWIKGEAVVDSVAVDCATSRKRVPRLKVEETPESRRGETWTCAGGKEIKNECGVTIHWTGSGVLKKGVFKVGAVSRTPISVDRLQETGHDVIPTKNHPRIINVKTGEVMPCRKWRGMFILDMWLWVPTSQSESEECTDFCEAKVIRLHDGVVSPCSETEDTEGECDKLVVDDVDIFTLNVDGGALGEEMECELEHQAEQDADRLRSISDSGQPSRRERKEHEATDAQCRSWCIARVRGRGFAMKHLRNVVERSDEKRLHTFVLDYCSSQGSQQGITVLVVKEMKTKAVGAFVVPSEKLNEYLVKMVADFMSACGRAILKSVRELSIVALQEAF